LYARAAVGRLLGSCPPVGGRLRVRLHIQEPSLRRGSSCLDHPEPEAAFCLFTGHLVC